MQEQPAKGEREHQGSPGNPGGQPQREHLFIVVAPGLLGIVRPANPEITLDQFDGDPQHIGDGGLLEGHRRSFKSR
jgi:hypothetical protein